MALQLSGRYVLHTGRQCEYLTGVPLLKMASSRKSFCSLQVGLPLAKATMASTNSPALRHRFAMDQLRHQVDPVLFLCAGSLLVASSPSAQGAVRRAASGAKQHHMTAGAGQRWWRPRRCLARSANSDHEPSGARRSAGHPPLAGTRFLSTTQRLIFQGGDPRLCYPGRVFVNRLVVCDKSTVKSLTMVCLSKVTSSRQ